MISPPGYGVDCHRTWEALALGSIPIVLAPASCPRGWQNPLFGGLRVITVRSWAEITQEALERWHGEACAGVPAQLGAEDASSPLGMSYWLRRLEQAATSQMGGQGGEGGVERAKTRRVRVDATAVP